MEGSRTTREPVAMRSILWRAFLCAALAGSAFAAESSTKTGATQITSPTPCVAKSSTGAFYDLRPDIVVLPEDDEKKPAKGQRIEEYSARGYDYGSNFTLNICSPVVKTPQNVVGVEPAAAWETISAWYDANGKTYSLGQQSSEIISRGRRLVLQYTGGSPCGTSDNEKRSTVHRGSAYKSYDDDDDDDHKVDANTKAQYLTTSESSSTRRKSATISLLCDRDVLTDTSASFVGTDPDECAYFFEVRSQHACPTAEPHKPGSVGPASVFAIIFVVAVLVYIFGGIFYQRTVAHARGWRQLPNYSLWAGIWRFLHDSLTVVTSSCARYMPSRRGYRSLAVSPTGRYRNREDENRLIDQLDEEWDD